MLEILFIFGAIGWLAGMAWEFLSGLAAFPTILTAAVAVPLVACADYLSILQRLELAGMTQNRVPVPPERFYWTLHRNRLQGLLFWNGLLTVAGWWVALVYPADLSLAFPSVVGWAAGAAAIFASARVVANGTVYLARLALVRPDGAVGGRRVPPDDVQALGESRFLGPRRGETPGERKNDLLARVRFRSAEPAAVVTQGRDGSPSRP